MSYAHHEPEPHQMHNSYSLLSDFLSFDKEASANPVHRAFQASLFSPPDPESHYLQDYFNVYLKKLDERVTTHCDNQGSIQVKVPSAS